MTLLQSGFCFLFFLNSLCCTNDYAQQRWLYTRVFCMISPKKQFENLLRFTSSPGQSQTVFHSQRSRIVIRKLASNDKTKSQVIPFPDPSIFQRYIREHARKSPRNGFMFVYLEIRPRISDLEFRR